MPKVFEKTSTSLYDSNETKTEGSYFHIIKVVDDRLAATSESMRKT